jgi:hypothetical protein
MPDALAKGESGAAELVHYDPVVHRKAVTSASSTLGRKPSPLLEMSTKYRQAQQYIARCVTHIF